MKRCTRCEKHKPLEEFYRDRSRTDGRRPYCIDCDKVYEQSEKGIARHRAGSKRWAKTPKGRAYSKVAHAAYARTEKGKAARKRINARNPARHCAHQAVHVAIKAGKLPRPDTCACADCGDAAVNYHHESYDRDRRLDVEPLCRQCHTSRHHKPAAEILQVIPATQRGGGFQRLIQAL